MLLVRVIQSSTETFRREKSTLLGIIETLGSIISHGTSKKFADVRTHLRKVSKKTLSFNLGVENFQPL